MYIVATRREWGKGAEFWNSTPRLTIYTEGLDLDQLVFSKGLTLLQVGELSKTYRDALDSRSQRFADSEPNRKRVHRSRVWKTIVRTGRLV